MNPTLPRFINPLNTPEYNLEIAKEQLNKFADELPTKSNKRLWEIWMKLYFRFYLEVNPNIKMRYNLIKAQ